ncbi:hypothetical protein CEXT_804581 [Caerostris extrusa]|uniref:Uncharacterized protein n=1 Tax=Caerostris extrusa TaxID=172846 RepID=A0AAV4NY75_CAEEX|nr:hypothetical protein CEXT_804581 [Caerostris extrusa]
MPGEINSQHFNLRVSGVASCPHYITYNGRGSPEECRSGIEKFRIDPGDYGIFSRKSYWNSAGLCRKHIFDIKCSSQKEIITRKTDFPFSRLPLFINQKCFQISERNKFSALNTSISECRIIPARARGTSRKRMRSLSRRMPIRNREVPD